MKRHPLAERERPYDVESGTDGKRVLVKQYLGVVKRMLVPPSPFSCRECEGDGGALVCKYGKILGGVSRPTFYLGDGKAVRAKRAREQGKARAVVF